jgi:2-dehydro-3-deoxyglucarate aldolase/4-hydroxy-2-oxoheptanedioate aldolase
MFLDNGIKFRDKLRRGEVCLGPGITTTDPTITEALCNVVDFLWIDMEHNPLSLEAVQGHVMATRGSDTAPLVRVAWNDPVLIKPVLDLGAAGVIVPFVRTAEEARRAVAACRYPPEGIRGFGPRRPSNYGRLGGPDFCKAANDAVLVNVQVEHVDAVRNIDEIVAVPGLTSIVLGPNDLAGSMGYMGQPRHPDVIRTLELVIGKARRAGLFVGIGLGEDPDILIEWVDRGVNWLQTGAEFSLMLRSAVQVMRCVRAHAANPAKLPKSSETSEVFAPRQERT